MNKKEKCYIFEGYLRINRHSREGALVYLYENLIAIQKDYPYCVEFLNSVNLESINENAIVHIFNALSPSKENIANWDHFVAKARQRLVELVGEKDTKDLMKVVL